MKSKIAVLITFVLIYHGCFSQLQQLDDLNPRNFNPDFTDYDQKTTLYMGQLSELAYRNAGEMNLFFTDYVKKYPKSGTKIALLNNDNSDAQVLLWCNPEFLVVCFRGTQISKLKDIVADLKFWNYENNPSTPAQLANLPSGHGGFRRSLMNLVQKENIFDEMANIIRMVNPEADPEKFPVYLTGHSLGAGLSQMFINCLTDRFSFAGAYHFAPPLAVTCDLNESFKKQYGERCYDIVNYKDYIPRAGRIGVAHFGKFYRICDDGLLFKEAEAYVKMTACERRKEFEYHSLANHISKIRDTRNDSRNVSGRSADGDFPCMGKKIKVINPCQITTDEVNKSINKI